MNLLRTALASLLLLCLAVAAFGLAGQYMEPSNVYIQVSWPGGLEDLMKSPSWVYGWWFMNTDHFAYAGDTAAFQDFLSRYAKLDVAEHTLAVHSGRGSQKAIVPGLKEKEFTYDWALTVNNGVIYQGNPAPPPSLSLELWTGGTVNLADIRVPKNVKVSRDPQAATPASAEGPIVYNTPIALKVVAGAGREKDTVRLETLLLHYEKQPDIAGAAAAADLPSPLIATITAKLVSYPKGKWEIRMSLLDSSGVELATAADQFENSGIAIGIGEISDRTFDLKLKWLPVRTSAKLVIPQDWRLTVRQIPLAK